MVKVKSPVALRTRKGKRGESLYLDIYINGKRKYEYLNLYLSGGKTAIEKMEDKKKMAIALQIKRKREEEIENGHFGIKLDDDLFVFISKFDKFKTKTYSSTISKLKLYVGQRPLRFSDVDDSFISDFFYYCKDQKLKDSSCVTYYQLIKAILNFAEKRGYKTNKITWVPTNLTPSAEREYLSLEEIQKLMAMYANSDNVIMRAFLFSCLTGLRISDIKKLRHSQIRKEGLYHRLFFRQTKTKKQEYLDINEQAYNLLFHRENDELIFPFGGNTNFYSILKKSIRKAGIERHISFHCARHSFAILMLNLGTDLYTVSKLLGHSNIKTTQIYARVVDKKKQEAISKIPKLL